VTDEDQPVAVTLRSDGDDPAGLRFALVTMPGHGALIGTPPDLTYAPDGDFHGQDVLTYRVFDGAQGSALIVVNLSVTPVNDAPVASRTRAFVTRANRETLVSSSLPTGEEYTSAEVTLRGSDADGDGLVYEVVTGPAHGTLSGEPPLLTYTPGSTFHGRDRFFFRVTDGRLESAPAPVLISDLGPPAPGRPLVATLRHWPDGEQTLRLHVDGVPGVSAELQESADLRTWTTLMTSAPDEATEYEQGLQDHPLRRFYRVLFRDLEPGW
jgi:hypothetical protein